MFKYKHEQAKAASSSSSSNKSSSWASAFSSSSKSPPKDKKSSSSSLSSSAASTSKPSKSAFNFASKEQVNSHKNSVFNKSPFLPMSSSNKSIKVDRYEVDNKRYFENNNRAMGTGYSNSRIYNDNKLIGFQSTSFSRDSNHCPKCGLYVTSEVARRTTYSYLSSPKIINPVRGDFSYSKHKCRQ